MSISQAASLSTAGDGSRGRITSSPLLSAVVFQSVWFGCVLGAAWDYAWVGPVLMVAAVSLEAATASRPGRLLSPACAAVLLGLITDSALAAGGWITFGSPLSLAWLSPPWMVALWPNFILALQGCLRWLDGRYRLGALLGAIGGPAAYAGGARLGAMQFADPVVTPLLVGLVWLAAVPILLWLNRRPGLETVEGSESGKGDIR